jgi:radical SAM superfamily enzyme YgiQ (UPF0313 family)
VISKIRDEASPIRPKALLLSTYDMGRQPFGLASPAAWLREAGAEVRCQDLGLDELDEAAAQAADLIGFHRPMHTATRLALPIIERVRALNPRATICAYGLYAPLNAERLEAAGADVLIGGEFEAELAALVPKVGNEGPIPQAPIPQTPQVPIREPIALLDRSTIVPSIPLDRLDFITPDRRDLPGLDRYAGLIMGSGEPRRTGYTEASRGCKHLCRHCPIVPVYQGRFRVVPVDVVMQDIAQQVAAGAEHITFGDPDFLNGPGHALKVVRALHSAFPSLSYDLTIKVEHLLKHADLLPELRDTGCVLITSAVESVDERVLKLLDKGHSCEDFERMVALLREVGIALNPTFVAFHPWLSLEDYRDLLSTLAELVLVQNVSPVQLAIRLLIPAGSKMLDIDELAPLVGDFDPEALVHRWAHPDPRVDALQRQVEARVAECLEAGHSREAIFGEVWRMASVALGDANNPPVPDPVPSVADATHSCGDAVDRRAPIPYLSETWYC